MLCERCGHLADQPERHNAVAGVECPAGTTEFRPATPEEIKKYGRREPGPPRPGTWRFKQQEREKKADERAARKAAKDEERQRKRAEKERRAGERSGSANPAPAPPPARVIQRTADVVLDTFNAEPAGASHNFAVGRTATCSWCIPRMRPLTTPSQRST
ncbi:hypothetical protein [Nannocystis pusilla]|uniref:hypothetical protein n=1 Tax=Nannocystis pusilla TaxID=889268 RepID=UPI003B7BD6C2